MVTTVAFNYSNFINLMKLNIEKRPSLFIFLSLDNKPVRYYLRNVFLESYFQYKKGLYVKQRSSDSFDTRLRKNIKKSRKKKFSQFKQFCRYYSVDRTRNVTF